MTSRRLIALLFVAALVPRVVAAILLPSVDWDAYEYTERAQVFARAMVDGSFSVKLLYGFWLPAYALVCAVFDVLGADPYYVPKLISAACGAGVCVLGWLTTRRLTGSPLASAVAYLMLALAPLQILYSASAMTEMPSGLFVAASLYLAVTDRWKAAAAAGAAACFIRYDAWMLVPLVPALAWLRGRRRDAVVAAAILVVPIAAWLLVCQLAMGNAFAQFRGRAVYLEAYYRFNAATTSFTAENVAINLYRLVFSANPAFIGLATATGIASFVRRGGARRPEVLVAAAYFFAYLGFLAFSYFSRNQPELWVRYGLVLATIGTPLFMWALVELGARWPWTALVVGPAVGMALLAGWGKQVEGTVQQIRNLEPQRVAAAFVRAEAARDRDGAIFCDDPAIRVLSRVPAARFVRTMHMPKQNGEPLEELRPFLARKGVRLLVYAHFESSILNQLAPELRDGAATPGFTPVLVEPIRSAFHGGTPSIWIYRVASN